VWAWERNRAAGRRGCADLDRRSGADRGDGAGGKTRGGSGAR
jgi:hypothetical protein